MKTTNFLPQFEDRPNQDKWWWIAAGIVILFLIVFHVMTKTIDTRQIKELQDRLMSLIDKGSFQKYKETEKRLMEETLEKMERNEL